MPPLVRHPGSWLAGFIVWFAVLWLLSSSTGHQTYLPPADHLDKLAHFGYFFGGGGLLCAFLYRLRSERPRWRCIIFLTVLILAGIGALDEWHQSFTPGRSGNDPYDWLADFLGATTGALTFKRFHRRLQ